MEILLDGKKIRIRKKFKTFLELLDELKISKQTTIIKVNGKITLPENPIPKNGSIELIRVVFGG
jgi:sulfur carrier protein ThiS